METIIGLIGQLLGYVIRPCYLLLRNYGGAILLFVLLSKFVLLPISIWVQKNGIKMVRMQPEINWLKVNYFGDLDTIADKQSDIYKKHRYNAFASVIPLLIQVVILLGLVEVIYNPLRYILCLPEEISSLLVALTGSLTGADTAASSIQMAVVNAARTPAIAEAFASEIAAHFPAADAARIAEQLAAFEMNFLGLNLSWIPSETGGWTLLVPLLAALSAWIMCVTQNQAQVLQAEQGKINQYGTMAISVALSLYLGFFVPAGIGLYWIAGNLLSIVQMYLLNIAINPKKYVDYAELEKSRAALAEMESLAGGKKKGGLFSRDPESKRERADYKRFFSVLNKHVVFYSEKSGFWKYYDGIIRQLLKKTNVKIHYITNDPNDQVFDLAKEQSRIIPYYIGPRRLITLMMKMDADLVVMTTPDLETFQIKRSRMRRDVEYIYTPHDPMSIHMGFREGALDHFDTVLCAGPQQMAEIRATEKVYGLAEKTLVPCGYTLLDDLTAAYEQAEKTASARKRILIAPSWQEDNLLDSVIDDLIRTLLCDRYQLVVRPHPEYVKRYKTRLDSLMQRWESHVGDGLSFETDFSSNRSIWTADALITDWSGIAYEYSYTTGKPTLFINTKIKALNPNWENIGITPLEIALRDQIGVSLEKDEIARASDALQDMVEHADEWRQRIMRVREENIFHLGHAGEKAAAYIISRLTRKKEA